MAMDSISVQSWCVNSAFPVVLADIEYDGELSALAYVILSVVLLGITFGLGWCFYRAVTTDRGTVEPQSPDEVGDEEQQQGADAN